MSDEYTKACERHTAEYQIFKDIREKYRAYAITDAEFLAAKRIMQTADKAYYAAYAIAAGH